MDGAEYAPYSLATLCAIASFWPARVPLAFVSTQPRCRIAAELRTCEVANTDGASRDSIVPDVLTPQGACSDVEEAWTAWATQLPFGEWWVSQLQQAVVPSEAQTLRRCTVQQKNHCSSFARRSTRHETNEANSNRKDLTQHSQSHPYAPFSPSFSPPPPSPPFSAGPHASAAALAYMDEHGCSYRDFVERRVATVAQFQSGVLDTNATIEGDSRFHRSCSARAVWRDCSYPGERLWCLSVRGGYAGGVHVGHLVSFLIPLTRPQEQQHRDATGINNSAGVKGRGGQSNFSGERSEVPFRRVLHWDVRGDELYTQREGRNALNDRDGLQNEFSDIESQKTINEMAPSIICEGEADGAAKLSSALPLPGSGDRVQLGTTALNSWALAYWWLCRPLTLTRQAPHFSSDRNSQSSATPAGAEEAEATTIQADIAVSSAPGAVDTSMYVYGSHPASFASVCRPARNNGGPSRNTRTLTHFSPQVDSQCDQLRAHSPVSCSRCEASASFLTALHFSECRSADTAFLDGTKLPLASPPREASTLSDSTHRVASAAACLPAWLDSLQSACGRNSRLTRLEVDLEGCVGNEGATRTASAAPVVAAAAAPAIPIDRGAPSSLPQMKSKLTNEELQLRPELEKSGPKHTTPLRASAVSLSSSLMSALTEMCLVECGLQDVNFLGALPHLRLADVSRNVHLTDAGVVGVARSSSLRIFNLSHCPHINAAAACVATVTTLEELYLSWTGLTDATLRSIAAQQRERTPHQKMRPTFTERVDMEANTPIVASSLRVLHVDGCRHLADPLKALTARSSMDVSGPFKRKRQKKVEGERGGLWAGLTDFRAAAVALRRPVQTDDSMSSEHDGASGSDNTDASDAGDMEAAGEAAEDTGAQQSHAALAEKENENTVEKGALLLAFRQVNDEVELRGTQGVVGTLCIIPDAAMSLSALSHTLTKLQLNNILLRSSFCEAGPLTSLQQLLLHNCTAVAAEEDTHRVPQQLSADHRHQPSLQNAWYAGLEACSHLRAVTLEACDNSLVNEGSLRCLGQLCALEDLSLDRSSVRDADLRAFVDALQERGASQWPQCALVRLSLSLCSLLSHIRFAATLNSLRVLDLTDTAVAQDFVDALVVPNSQLQESPTQQRQLASSSPHALQVLKLTACPLITGASALAHLRSLRQLDLSHTPVSTVAVAGLRHCPSLTYLSLKGCAGVSHLRDVLRISTLEVLNAQGTGLFEETLADGREAFLHDTGDTERHASESAARGAGTPRFGSFARLSPVQSPSSPSQSEPQRSGETAVVDVFPEDDDVLRRSSLHTLLLSHTRVRCIRRLGLAPWLMCLDLAATAVTDAELAKFVCTGLRQCSSRVSCDHDMQAAAAVAAATNTDKMNPSTQTDSNVRNTSWEGYRTYSGGLRVVESLHELCEVGARLPLSYNTGRGGCASDTPRLRVLSLQLCRHIFTVGVLGLCPFLTKLDLSSSNVTSRGLLGVHRCRRLTQLRLDGCKGVYDLRVLGQLRTLREVEGRGCNVDDARLPGCATHTTQNTTRVSSTCATANTCPTSPQRDTDDAADCEGGTSVLPKTTKPLLTPSHLLLTRHSDLFRDVSLTQAEAAGLRRLVEGDEECFDEATIETATATAIRTTTTDVTVSPSVKTVTAPPLYTPPAFSASHVCAVQLRRLVLDGCANLHGGLAALRHLPALLELSLCNCDGIIAEAIQELAREAHGHLTDGANSADARKKECCDTAERLVGFPTLQVLRLSSCRQLTGTLHALAVLPLLRYVHVEQCGITSTDDVVAVLRSRVVL